MRVYGSMALRGVCMMYTVLQRKQLYCCSSCVLRCVVKAVCTACTRKAQASRPTANYKVSQIFLLVTQQRYGHITRGRIANAQPDCNKVELSSAEQRDQDLAELCRRQC